MAILLKNVLNLISHDKRLNFKIWGDFFIYFHLMHYKYWKDIFKIWHSWWWQWQTERKDFSAKERRVKNFHHSRKSIPFLWTLGVPAPGDMAKFLLVVLGLLLAGAQAEINFGDQKCGDPKCESKWPILTIVNFLP